MEQTIQNFLNQIVTALGGLAIAYLTLYIAKAKAKLEAEADKIKDEKAKALVDSSLERLNDLVLKGVNSAQQTLIADIKKQIALGKATPEDLLAVGKNVANTVYSQLSADTLDVLELEITDVQNYIIDSVEAQILTLKKTIVVTPIVVATDAIESSDASVQAVSVDASVNSTVELGVL